ncbi:MAG: PAS domain-containing protein [Kiritimatiellae bacterium]|nr:PAS domain-containing protein [Kiritimatiellia bacterium]
MPDRVDKLEFLNDRLSRRRVFFETILRTMQDGVVVATEDGILKYANRAAGAMLGFDPDEAAGRPAERWLPGVDWAALSRGDESGRESFSSSELEAFRPQRAVFSLSAFPIEDGAGRAALVILRDVTRERADAQEALESGRMQAVRVLAASLAHEIGNPLNALGIHLQLLGREVKTVPDGAVRDDLAELVQVARDEVDRLDLVLSKFLNALRGGAPDLAPCDVAEVLQRTLRVMRADIQERAIRVDLEHPAQIPKIRADAEQLQQAFFNLVKNAVQAMGDGGTLRIAVSCDDRDLAVAFSDTGPGMEPEEYARLFQPFHTSKPDGHGIGLSIVRRIVQDHGGRIEVSSRPGSGTTFRLVFPLADRKARLISAKRD